MSAAVAAISHEAANVFHEIAKASAGWDPIGSMVASTDSRNANLIGNFFDKTGSKVDPAYSIESKMYAPLEKAGDEVRDWGSWVPETINAAGTAVDDGMRDIGVDPNTVKMAIGSVALTMTGQAWAIPLLNAAMVKAQGGSWEDMALAAATSYVASAAGAYVGDYVSSAVTDGVAVTPGQVAAQTGISASSQQAAQIAAQNAAALGAGTTFTAGALSNMAAAGVSDATAQLLRTGSIDINKALTTAASAGITSGVSALTKQVPGFADLPASVQKTINTQIASSLQGKDVNVDALGMSLASDMAMSAVKNFYKDGFGAVESAYNKAASAFNEVSASVKPYVDAMQSAWDALSPIQEQVEVKVAEVNALIDTANANKDSSLAPKIDALKSEATALIAQRDALVPEYQKAVDAYNQVKDPVESALATALERRADVFTSLAKSVDPEFDAAAFMYLNPDLAKQMYSAGTYGMGMSAAEAYITQQAENPDTPMATSWREGFLTTAPEKFSALDAAYQKATGSSITADFANKDFATYAAYQTGLANSTQDLLNKASAAEAAGDTATYSQLMGQALKQASSENLGWVQQDQSGNYIWGNQVYNSQGTLVGDYTPPTTTEPGATLTEGQQHAQSLYSYLPTEEVSKAQEAAQIEAVKAGLTAQGYTATTQEEARQLAGAGNTFQEVTDPLAAYAKEHTVSEGDVANALKQFNYGAFAKSLTPYIGQGAQYAQSKLTGENQQKLLQDAMLAAMRQSQQYSPASYSTSGTSSGTTAGLTGLAALLGGATLGGATLGGTMGAAPEAPQAQIQTRAVTPYSDTPAEAAGKVGILQQLQREGELAPQVQQTAAEAPRQFGDIQPTSEEDNMSEFRAGGVIPNANFGYTDQVQAMASGGIAALAAKHTGSDLGSYSDGGQLLRGPGTGLSDNIPATIERNQPARLASGEFVISADVVSALGGGSTEAGAKILYDMMDRVRQQAHGSKQQIKPVNPSKVLPR